MAFLGIVQQRYKNSWIYLCDSIRSVRYEEIFFEENNWSMFFENVCGLFYKARILRSPFQEEILRGKIRPGR